MVTVGRIDELEGQHTLATAVHRFDELRMRDSLASTVDSTDGSAEAEEALSAAEALELLALGEVVARKAHYGRELTVRSARAAGASWAQIADALGTTRQSAREAHSRWLSQ